MVLKTIGLLETNTKKAEKELSEPLDGDWLWLWSSEHICQNMTASFCFENSSEMGK